MRVKKPVRRSPLSPKQCSQMRRRCCPGWRRTRAPAAAWLSPRPGTRSRRCGPVTGPSRVPCRIRGRRGRGSASGSGSTTRFFTSGVKFGAGAGACVVARYLLELLALAVMTLRAVRPVDLAEEHFSSGISTHCRSARRLPSKTRRTSNHPAGGSSPFGGMSGDQARRSSRRWLHVRPVGQVVGRRDEVRDQVEQLGPVEPADHPLRPDPEFRVQVPQVVPSQTTCSRSPRPRAARRRTGPGRRGTNVTSSVAGRSRRPSIRACGRPRSERRAAGSTAPRRLPNRGAASCFQNRPHVGRAGRHAGGVRGQVREDSLSCR